MRALHTIIRKALPSSIAGRSRATRGLWNGMLFTVIFSLSAFFSCMPEPPLHLYDAVDSDFRLPVIDLDLQVYWDYELAFGIDYDWRAEWYYGWDNEDRRVWGEIGYTEPTTFNIRRYYTGDVPYAPHTSVLRNTIEGTHFQGRFDWGFWDILVWNQIYTLNGVHSLIFDEETTLDSVTAYTNQSMNVARYNAPRYTHSFWSPEPLFAAYDQAIDINTDLKDFTFDEEYKAWLLRIAANRCKDLLKSHWYKFSEPLDEQMQAPENDEETKDELLSALSRLGAKTRTVLYMYYYEEYSVKEIAELMGDTETAVTSQLWRGRKRLKELLKKDDCEEGSELCDGV